jgi:CRISPR/Cas system-associated protein Cas5 (RAMP superfamily)
LCLLFVVNLGYSQIINGVGTSFVISLILIPLSTAIGILAKHTQKKYRKKVNI